MNVVVESNAASPGAAATADYSLALAAVEGGCYEQAAEHIRRHLTVRPADGPAWNDAGVILYRLGCLDEAATCLDRAMDLAADAGQVAANLIQVRTALGHGHRVAELLVMAHRYGQLNDRRICDIVEQLAGRGDLAGAMETLLAAKALPGAGKTLDSLAHRIRALRPRVAFFCGGDGPTFLGNILPFVTERFDVEQFSGNTVGQVHELMNRSHICWFEWCSELAELGSRHPAPCRRIVRLHRYEAYLDWPRRIDWGNVDVLVTVGNRFVLEALKQQVPDIASRTRIITIPNGVDLDRIPFVPRTQGPNLAFVGNLRMVKNPMLLLQCIRKLLDRDPRYRLCWAGRVQDPALEQYLRHMIRALGIEAAIALDGWQTDVRQWLRDKHFIVCTSVIESQGMGVLEAMAAGLKPVVHNFPGAEDTFGPQCLFNTPEQFCDHILSGNYDSAAYRAFVEERYSLRGQLARIGGLLNELEKTIPVVPRGGPSANHTTAVPLSTAR